MIAISWMFNEITDFHFLVYFLLWGFPGGSESKESACNAGGLGSIPGLTRSSGEGNGYLLQYSGLENSMDRGSWWATVYVITNSQTWLTKNFIQVIFFFLFLVYCAEWVFKIMQSPTLIKISNYLIRIITNCMVYIMLVLSSTFWHTVSFIFSIVIEHAAHSDQE